MDCNGEEEIDKYLTFYNDSISEEPLFQRKGSDDKKYIVTNDEEHSSSQNHEAQDAVEVEVEVEGCEWSEDDYQELSEPFEGDSEDHLDEEVKLYFLQEVKDEGSQNRANNTIFKTSLSQFKKAMMSASDLDHEHGQQIQQEVKKVCKKKNFATFPKLLVLAQKMQLRATVLPLWEKKWTALIAKKKKSLSESRFEELMKTIVRMNEALREVKIEAALEKYWGVYRQKTKYQKCLKQVKTYQKQLKTTQLGPKVICRTRKMK